MVYTGNIEFPDKLFGDFQLPKIGIFVNCQMNGSCPEIFGVDEENRDHWHTIRITPTWQFKRWQNLESFRLLEYLITITPVSFQDLNDVSTPAFARLTVGKIRNAGESVDFSHEGLIELTTIKKAFFKCATGTFFLVIWDPQKLQERSDEFQEKGKPYKLQDEFRKKINSDCEDFMRDEAEENGLKAGILKDPDISILASGFYTWWHNRLKNLKKIQSNQPEENWITEIKAFLNFWFGDLKNLILLFRIRKFYDKSSPIEFLIST